MGDKQHNTSATPRGRRFTPEARRALAEAEARRAAAKRDRAVQAGDPKPAEIGGPGQPEPTRYGDWERKGIASDF